MPDEEESTQKIRAAIGGVEYTLRGDATETHLRAVARSVDTLMQQIASANPRLDERRIAVLAAVNFADELIRLRNDFRDLKGDYDDLHALLDAKTETPKTPKTSQNSKGGPTKP